MRIFLAVLVLIFSCQSWTKADDIKDFEIEGISIGDSLLDHVEKEKIIQNSANIYDVEGALAFVDFFDNSSAYDGYQATYFKDDDDYKIIAIMGAKLFENNIEECYLLREKIVSQVKELFQNASIESEKTSHDGDPTGESMITYSRFYINDDSKYEDLQIGCTDWSENHKFANGVTPTDKLTVTITTDEYFEFLQTAY